MAQAATDRRRTARPGQDRRRAFAGLLTGMTLLALLAAIFASMAMQMLSGGRAYVHGEGRWSKAQQETAFFLDRYAERGDPADLARARQALRVPLGDREARQALLAPDPDPQRARAGFRRGGNHPDDIPAMIWLLRHFADAPYFRDAIDIWTRADRDILRLQAIAGRLEAEWADAPPATATMHRLRSGIAAVDQRLRRLENDFSATLNEGLRVLELVLTITGVMVALILLTLALLMFRWATRHIRASEQKFWAGFVHAPVGFALLSPGGRCTEVNHTLCDQFGYGQEDLLGQEIECLVHPDEREGTATLLDRASDRPQRLERRCLHRDGHTIWCEMHLCPLPPGGDRSGAYVLVLKDIDEERARRERLSYEASHDTLTGLFNRGRFVQEMDATLGRPRDGSHHVLGFIDLDRFKPVNDSCGHAAGDEVLVDIAGLMRARLRASDMLARMGGDEFAFLLRECPLDRGRAIAEAIRAAVAAYEFTHDGHRFPLSVSIGLVPLDRAATDVDTVLRAADEACYEAKNRGRDRIEVQRLPAEW